MRGTCPENGYILTSAICVGIPSWSFVCGTTAPDPHGDLSDYVNPIARRDRFSVGRKGITAQCRP